jgi:hypothetical protein
MPSLRGHDDAAIDTSSALNPQTSMDDTDTVLTRSIGRALVYDASAVKMGG